MDFIFGFFTGAATCLLVLTVIAQSGVIDGTDEYNDFIKVCPQYDVGFYNDKYKLSCDKGVIELPPYRYKKLLGTSN
ncbi:hypothetical protein ROW55_021315 [Providencia rettgeri]|uniref:hypothetical protein n=1 Tax=Providencia TaxID=586 RepID=UPI001B383086|nr:MULTISPECIES: hypothetical protein [Providencia]MBQ0211376.1 hypothetical protein [Providencia rettgeri]MDH2379519.1 hypothetical protein [Providencia rettgeri]MDR9616984.1 hypothetical protein [Providencia rettgeri]MDW7803747.1 hypothetical protein [Providencia rettgeri]